MLFFYQLAD